MASLRNPLFGSSWHLYFLECSLYVNGDGTLFGVNNACWFVNPGTLNNFWGQMIPNFALVNKNNPTFELVFITGKVSLDIIIFVSLFFTLSLPQTSFHVYVIIRHHHYVVIVITGASKWILACMSVKLTTTSPLFSLSPSLSLSVSLPRYFHLLIYLFRINFLASVFESTRFSPYQRERVKCPLFTNKWIGATSRKPVNLTLFLPHSQSVCLLKLSP